MLKGKRYFTHDNVLNISVLAHNDRIFFTIVVDQKPAACCLTAHRTVGFMVSDWRALVNVRQMCLNVMVLVHKIRGCIF